MKLAYSCLIFLNFDSNRKPMKQIIFLLLLAFSIQLNAQKGIPYIVNFEPDERYRSSVYSISQDERGIMLFATKKGILTFDGYHWTLVKTSNTPLQIEYSNQAKVNYTLFKNYLAKVYIDEFGNFKIDSIFGNTDSINGFEYLNITAKNFFVSTENQVAKLDPDYNLFAKYKLPSYSNGQFVFNDFLYISDNSDGLLKLENEELIKVSGGAIFKNNGIVFTVPIAENKILIVTDNDEFLIFDGQTFESYSIEDSKYVVSSIISSGSDINDNYFSISTLIGGTIIIEKANGKTFSILNYQNGLPDDEIAYSFLDKTGGVWLAHEYGFSRFDLTIPVSAYHYFPNLIGNINAVFDHSNGLYVASSEGVFRLEKKEHHKAKEISVKVKTQVTEEEEIKVDEEETTIEPVAEDQEKNLTRKERRALKRKQQKEKAMDIISNVVETIAETPTKTETKTKTVTREEYQVVKKKIYELQSVSYAYRSITNIDDKVRTIFVYQNKIVAFANSGLYEIVNNSAKKIYSGDYIYQFDVYENHIWLYTDDGIKIVSFEDNFWNITSLVIDINEEILGMKSFGNSVALAFPDEIKLIQLDEDYFETDIKTIPFPSTMLDEIFFRKLDNEIYVFTPDEIYKIDDKSLKITSDNFQNNNFSYKYISNSDGIIWVKQDDGWYGYNNSIRGSIKNNFLNLFNKITFIAMSEEQLWVVNDKEGIFKLPSGSSQLENKTYIELGSISNSQRKLTVDEKLSVKHSDSDLTFYFLAPSYQTVSGSSFQYKFDGLMKEWSEWTKEPIVKFPFIPAGSYTLYYKSRDVFGNETESKEITIDIKPPFYQTFWFLIIVIAVVIVLAYFVMQLRERKLKHDKMVLEQKVKERTAEVVRQKEEIAEQKEEIEASIYYAKRIQKAIVPSDEFAEKILPEHFILWKPRDIVSGDFYWLNEMDGKVIAVAADCTGHGVPGAFMSMLGVSFLNEIVANLGLEDAGVILDQLRNKVKTTLGQTGKEGEAKDGMDLALCIYDPKTKLLQYAGAYNPLYIIRNNEILETKADKMPIGIYIKEKEHFTNHQIQLKKNDTIYIFSDGYVDQFGGEKNGKFKPKRFKEKILAIQKDALVKQKEILDTTIEEWKGNNDQVDDILVIGIRIN